MKSVKTLPIRNLIKKPARSAALLILAAFMAVSAFGGTLAVMSLTNGLDSLEARLGADIIVVPYEATTQTTIDSIIIQGKPGYFYMSDSNLDKVSGVEGIEKISAQFFLASTKAGCCSAPLQIIGFDPETDFSIQPWVIQSYSDKLEYGDILVGSDVTLNADMTIKLFGMSCKVVSVLDKTGTELDTAVYTNVETIKALMKSAEEKGFAKLDTDPDKVISSILIKVKDGYDIDDITNYINLHVRKVKAIRAKSMVSGVSDSMAGVSSMIGTLIAVVWILAVIIMIIAFSMIMNERKKEFAVLRVLGASRGSLAGIVFAEAAIISFAGSLAGIAVTVIGSNLFANAIEEAVGLPFLVPNAITALVVGVIAAAVTVVAGALASAVSAVKISRLDTGIILRGDN